MNVFAWLEQRPTWFRFGAMSLLVALVGWVDYFTGTEIAFSVFYFIPIAGASYFVGRRAGLGIAVACALMWLFADLRGGHDYSSTAVALWNAGNRLVSFVVLAALMVALRQGYEHQRELAHSDVLTGARNRRRFLELVEQEITRARRFGRGFTVVHFDLDGFKGVNDRLGHSEGDAVLRAVVEATQRTLRETDVVARLGGDEFALLLPEAGSDPARRTVEKLQDVLVEEMRKHEWQVSFSIGVLTCLDPPADADQLMRLVDGLTYAAKTGGKNTAVYDVVAARLVSLAPPPRDAALRQPPAP